MKFQENQFGRIPWSHWCY